MLTEHEREELERAYRDLGPGLWRAIYAFTLGQREVTDDAIAHAFMEAGKRLASIRDLRSWLYAVAFREATSDMRNHRRSEHLHQPSTPVAAQNDAVEVLDLARALSPRQRAVFVLRDLLGFTSSETAELLTTSEVAVRVHLHAAHRRLRAQLEEAERT